MSEQLARKFHEAYERLAPEFGYATRDETKDFDPESPNGRLMIAVCQELQADLAGEERRELVKVLKAARTELRCLGRELASANHTATLLDDSVIDQIDEALAEIDALAKIKK